MRSKLYLPLCLILSLLSAVHLPAQTETVPPYSCPDCSGTNGVWSVSYPWSSQYASQQTKSLRKLVWGTLSSVIRNPPGEGATDVSRTTAAKVTFTYTVADSGGISVTIKSELSIPTTGSIGGGFTNKSTWTESVCGASEHEVQTGRVCHPGYAIWERAYYYGREDTGTRYRYNSGLSAQYWCPAVSCNAYTRTGYFFVDIYDKETAVFIYPSGEAGILTPTGEWDTDVGSSGYYSGLTIQFEDINLPPKAHISGKNW